MIPFHEIFAREKVLWLSGRGAGANAHLHVQPNSRVINYTASFNTDGNSYLAIYGWMTNPLVEYYVIENWGTHHPFDNPEAELKGNMTSDGGDYELMTKMRKNKPSIQGTATFAQYWAVRRERRSGGTVTMKNFFDAWKASGLRLGTQNYMLVAVEGQGSNGNASVTLGVVPPAQPTATGLP